MRPLSGLPFLRQRLFGVPSVLGRSPFALQSQWAVLNSCSANWLPLCWTFCEKSLLISIDHPSKATEALLEKPAIVRQGQWQSVLPTEQAVRMQVASWRLHAAPMLPFQTSRVCPHHHSTTAIFCRCPEEGSSFQISFISATCRYSTLARKYQVFGCRQYIVEALGSLMCNY
jgi:hypothetical protein